MTLMLTVPTNETPDEPRLSTLHAWQATSLCIVAFVLAIPVLFAPGILAGRLAPGALREPVVMGVLGSFGALFAFIGLAKGLRVSPAVFFIRYPDRTVIRWAGITLILVIALLTATSTSPGTTVRLSSVSPLKAMMLFAAALAIGLWTGIVEEFLLRGVILSVVGHQWNWPGAICVTALLFGFLHQGAGTTPLATGLYVSLTIVAGLLMGLVVVVTGNIWNAVAIHATWNAAFAGYLVGFNTPGPDSLISVASETGWLLGAGGAAVSESPLALGLFSLLLSAYWWHLERHDDPT